MAEVNNNTIYGKPALLCNIHWLQQLGGWLASWPCRSLRSFSKAKMLEHFFDSSLIFVKLQIIEMCSVNFEIAYGRCLKKHIYFWHTAFAFILHTTCYTLAESVHTASTVCGLWYSHTVCADAVNSSEFDGGWWQESLQMCTGMVWCVTVEMQPCVPVEVDQTTFQLQSVCVVVVHICQETQAAILTVL